MAEALTAPSRSLLASGCRRAGLQLRRELKRDFESLGTPWNRPRMQLLSPWYILYQGSECDSQCSLTLARAPAPAAASERLPYARRSPPFLPQETGVQASSGPQPATRAGS